MSQARYRVLLTGTLASGADADLARAELARLFKLSGEKVEALLADAPVVIKKGLDEATANKYQSALHKAGWLSEVRLWETPGGEAASAETPEPVAPAPETGPAPLQASLAPVGSLLADPREVPPLEVDLSEFSLAEPGARIGEIREVSAPQVDLSGLSLAEPGARLDKAPDG
ncbi:MAG TPA: hypothetical protein VLN90_08350, partial [Thioalkalivibrio sp.]|nr:hypothetical protein [Thioalkalivibrio sp.]